MCWVAGGKLHERGFFVPQRVRVRILVCNDRFIDELTVNSLVHS